MFYYGFYLTHSFYNVVRLVSAAIEVLQIWLLVTIAKLTSYIVAFSLSFYGMMGLVSDADVTQWKTSAWLLCTLHTHRLTQITGR